MCRAGRIAAVVLWAGALGCLGARLALPDAAWLPSILVTLLVAAGTVTVVAAVRCWVDLHRWSWECGRVVGIREGYLAARQDEQVVQLRHRGTGG
jgi:hypothetical protein